MERTHPDQTHESSDIIVQFIPQRKFELFIKNISTKSIYNKKDTFAGDIHVITAAKKQTKKKHNNNCTQYEYQELYDNL